VNREGDELAIRRTDIAAGAPAAFAILAASRALHGLGIASLQALGLHPGQELILMQLLETDGLTPTQLSQALGLDHSTISRSVLRMEQADLVGRSPSPRDRRATIVTLTDRGRSLEDPLRRLWEDLEHVAVGTLPERDRDAFIDVATRIELALQLARRQRDEQSASDQT
jgi:DNA-binding MarR family transcriptional regulator